MPDVLLKYRGFKASLHLRLPALEAEYEFLPENSLTCAVSAADARLLQDANPRMFEVVETPDVEDLVASQNGEDQQGDEEGESNDDTPPEEGREAYVRCRLEELGIKVPGTVKKLETLEQMLDKAEAE
ncbi:hypothetical protein ACI3L3_10125 [Desulfobaculum sp. SPO524]|uniref:hypothetical protein n=1 Tax=Desulfobaculum sp. SPO524 TaxID=3378071 RepID=UPI0038532B98